MFYFALAVLLGVASLMVDIAAAHGKAVKAMLTGGSAGGVSLMPGLIFYPATGCALCWSIDKFFPDYGPWIVGVPVTLITLYALSYSLRCRHLLRAGAAVK